MNKYQIMSGKRNSFGKVVVKGACLAKQTTYNAVEKLERLRRIRVVNTVKTRTGLPSKEYVLTDQGKYWATQLVDDPTLISWLKRDLGSKFTDFQQKVERGRAIDIDEKLARIRRLLTSRRAPPLYELGLTVKTNREGKVTWHYHSGYSTARPARP